MRTLSIGNYMEFSYEEKTVSVRLTSIEYGPLLGVDPALYLRCYSFDDGTTKLYEVSKIDWGSVLLSPGTGS